MKKAASFLLFGLTITAAYFLATVVLQLDSTSLFQPAVKLKFQDVETPYYVNRTGKHCNISFKWGKMCPKLYTELGGRCDLINGSLQCPDIRKYPKFRNRQGQLVLTRMLRIFDLLAQKHDIYYWIARGTLLGAARHHGFIPWDVDADIEIPLEDYVKLFQVVAKELPADIFFQNSISDPALNPEDRSSCHQHEIVGIYQQTWNPRFRDRHSCYKYCIAYGCKWHDGLMIDILVLPHVSRSVYPLKRLPFEGFTLPVQSDWKDELVSQYGKNWFEFPTDEEPAENADVFNGCEKLKS
ncbi:hypothetical protein OS493_021977 [Desmophyllum pertusum]|uniref:LicD/FKTN/FKRP nucleotidyltransferase domain-containing protein n=1 Tax=Desmophyllum pertusum TaxID=174260 RepID=A0A9X0CYZ3_9CNID|nr:hypothetical protein OS493_021977 [Desmophyllum pertusum]